MTTDAPKYKSLNHFEAIVNASEDAIISKSLDGVVSSWNFAAERIFGYKASEIIGKSITVLFPANLLHEEDAILEIIKNGGRVEHFRTVRVNKSGDHINVSVSISPIFNIQGQVIGVSKIARDINALVHSEAISANLTNHARHFESIVDSSDDAIVSKTLEGVVVSWNKASERMFGFSSSEMIGNKLLRLFPSNRQDEELMILNKIALGEKIDNYRSIRLNKNSTEIHVSVTVSPIFNEKSEVIGASTIIRDISETIEAENNLWKQANFDVLTGLPNRRLLNDRLSHAIEKSTRDNQYIATILIDLDNFKEVNDTLGHNHGDDLLIQASKRFNQCIRRSDTLARLGGDEFLVMLADIDEWAKVTEIATALVASLQTPFLINGKELYISCSVGVSIFPEHAETVDDLLKHADLAMYAAKRFGKNQFKFFNFDLKSSIDQHSYLVSDLRDAIKLKQFELYYQPIISVKTSTITKAEALIRWNHPYRGVVSPLVFIPIAEETGLIHEVGDWVFDEATKQLKDWQYRFNASFQMSINKSAIQFHADDCAETTIIDKLNSLGLKGSDLIIEITESALMNNTQASITKLFNFRDQGIQIAIDDFGTGYSSLSYLIKFDIDCLKIDMSFIRNLTENSNEYSLCEAIVVMAHKLGLSVIAEGVETTLQKDLLIKIGCDYLQGYLFSKPIPKLEFEVLLKEYCISS